MLNLTPPLPPPARLCRPVNPHSDAHARFGSHARRWDMIVAADVVYRRELHRPLLATLLACAGEGTEVMFGHVKRWKVRAGGELRISGGLRVAHPGREAKSCLADLSQRLLFPQYNPRIAAQHEGAFWKAFARSFEKPTEVLVQPAAPGQRRPAKVLMSRRVKATAAAAAAGAEEQQQRQQDPAAAAKKAAVAAAAPAGSVE